MALGDNYATNEELKIRLGINDNFDDTLLQAAVSTASRSVEDFCGRQFNDAETVSARLYYPTTFYEVDVDDFSTTTGLILKTDPAGDGSFTTTFPATAYQLEPLNGIVDGTPGYPFYRIVTVQGQLFIFPWYFYVRRAPIQVTARWGWTSVPAPVHEATLALAEEIVKMKDAPYGIAGFADFGAVRVRENPKIAMLLQSYKRYGVLVG
jgi:gp6-like head-tail connector protein